MPTGYGSNDTWNDDIWALRVLAVLESPSPRAGQVADMLAAGAQPGWAWSPSQPAEVDTTGMGLVALFESGQLDDRFGATVTWLASAVNPDGGWGLTEGAPSNCHSTAWALLGLLAAGADAHAAQRALDRFRTADGWSFDVGGTTSVFCTADALLADATWHRTQDTQRATPGISPALAAIGLALCANSITRRTAGRPD